MESPEDNGEDAARERPETIELALEPWAAMITCWNEQVSGFRQIVWSRKPEAFVHEASKTLSDFAILLNKHFAEDVSCSDLYLLFEDENENASEKEWSLADVEKKLKAIPQHALNEVAPGEFMDLTKCDWYGRISCLNDVYPDSSGAWINFSGPLSEFVDRLLKFEADDFSSFAGVTDKAAIYLGKLVVLSRLKWTGTIPIEQWKAVNAFFEQFNNWNSDLNSLD